MAALLIVLKFVGITLGVGFVAILVALWAAVRIDADPQD